MYLIFIAGMGYCCFYGYKNGDPAKIFAPIVDGSKFCGVDAEAKNMPYLYMPQFHNGDTGGATSFKEVLKTAICVDKCPGNAPVAGSKLSCYPERPGYCVGGQTVNELFRTRTLVKYCIPKGNLKSTVKDIYANMMLEMKGGTIGNALFDVYQATQPIQICFATSFAYCLLFIGILSLFAEPICWFCIVVVQLGLIGMPFMFGYKWHTLGQSLENTPDMPSAEKEIIQG